MITEKKIANAVSGKTARPCDCCLIKRARWYCPAEDAFLCQLCDGTVHSANPLAQRHDRVCLTTASPRRFGPVHLPSWHRGPTRKTRTPRQGKHPRGASKSDETLGHNPLPTVPELGSEDATSQDGEEHLLYRVPIYDPFVAELCTTSAASPVGPRHHVVVEGLCAAKTHLIKCSQDCYLPSDMDLEEFTVDVEALLGKGLYEESYFAIEELVLLGSKLGNVGGDQIITASEIEAESDDVLISEPFKVSFDYDDDHMVMMTGEPCKLSEYEKGKDRMMERNNKVWLRLNYEAISTTWASQGSPWIDGQRPEMNLEDCWPHCMGTCGGDKHKSLCRNHQILGGIGGHEDIRDGGREAKVSRYREKRRTRLFSTKIRYEVRKRNAEKRPRMKGRFVKRSSFAPAAIAFPLVSK